MEWGRAGSGRYPARPNDPLTKTERKATRKELETAHKQGQARVTGARGRGCVCNPSARRRASRPRTRRGQERDAPAAARTERTELTSPRTTDVSRRTETVQST